MEKEEAYLWRYGDISKKIFNVKKEEAHLWLPNGQCPLTSCVTFDVKDIAKKMLRSRDISTKNYLMEKDEAHLRRCLDMEISQTKLMEKEEMFRTRDISKKNHLCLPTDCNH